MRTRTLRIFVAFAATPCAAASAQDAIGGLQPGARVRLEVSGQPAWQSGRFVALDGNRLVLERSRSQVAFDLRDVTALQTRSRNGRGALIGAAIGTATALVLANQPAYAAGSSDVAGVAAIGGLVGAAWGSGRQARVAGGIGLLLGAAIGSVGYGTKESGCESGASRGCHYIVGGMFVGAIGLIVGTGIGFLLPNWVSLPLDDLRIGASHSNDPRFTIAWSVGL